MDATIFQSIPVFFRIWNPKIAQSFSLTSQRLRLAWARFEFPGVIWDSQA